MFTNNRWIMYKRFNQPNDDTCPGSADIYLYADMHEINVFAMTLLGVDISLNKCQRIDTNIIKKYDHRGKGLKFKKCSNKPKVSTEEPVQMLYTSGEEKNTSTTGNLCDEYPANIYVEASTSSQIISPHHKSNQLNRGAQGSGFNFRQAGPVKNTFKFRQNCQLFDPEHVSTFDKASEVSLDNWGPTNKTHTSPDLITSSKDNEKPPNVQFKNKSSGSFFKFGHHHTFQSYLSSSTETQTPSNISYTDDSMDLPETNIDVNKPPTGVFRFGEDHKPFRPSFVSTKENKCAVSSSKSIQTDPLEPSYETEDILDAFVSDPLSPNATCISPKHSYESAQPCVALSPKSYDLWDHRDPSEVQTPSEDIFALLEDTDFEVITQSEKCVTTTTSFTEDQYTTKTKFDELESLESPLTSDWILRKVESPENVNTFPKNDPFAGRTRKPPSPVSLKPVGYTEIKKGTQKYLNLQSQNYLSHWSTDGYYLIPMEFERIVVPSARIRYLTYDDKQLLIGGIMFELYAYEFKVPIPITENKSKPNLLSSNTSSENSFRVKACSKSSNLNSKLPRLESCFVESSVKYLENECASQLPAGALIVDLPRSDTKSKLTQFSNQSDRLSISSSDSSQENDCEEPETELETLLLDYIELPIANENPSRMMYPVICEPNDIEPVGLCACFLEGERVTRQFVRKWLQMFVWNEGTTKRQ